MISTTKRAFKVKYKTVSLVSQVLFFRHTNQTSKNVPLSLNYKTLFFVDVFEKIHIFK